ncbi:MAG: hypothetical protein QGI31_10650, partial [Dehalococcoidia bacterium]|nr:hypothetical protein [Dehalococcoidia bacterium]
GSAARPAVHQLIGLGHGGVYIDRNASAIKYGQVAAQRFIALASCVRIAYSGMHHSLRIMHTRSFY